MGGGSGRAAPLLPLGDPAGRREHPVAAHGTRPLLPCPPPPAGPHSAGVKTDPTSGPGEKSAAECRGVAGLSPTPRSLPLDHRAKGRSSPSRAFSRPPGKGCRQNRRFSGTAPRQPRLVSSASGTPRLLSQSEDRSRSPGDSLSLLTWRLARVPSLRRPEQQPRAGALCRATRREHPGDRARSGAKGREHGAQPSAGTPQASQTGDPSAKQGPPLWDPPWPPGLGQGQTPGEENQSCPCALGPHARSESPHSRAGRSSPASRKCAKEIARARVRTSCFKTLEKQLCCVQT